MTSPHRLIYHPAVLFDLLFVLIVSLLWGCAEVPASRLEQIWAEGRITVITDNNEQCYFMYRDAPVGFEYDLARLKEGGLNIEIVLHKNVPTEELLHQVAEGKIEITLETAREMGVKNRLDPSESIWGGVRYLNLLFHRFDDIDNRNDRM